MSELNNTFNDDDVTDVETTEDEWVAPSRAEWEDLLDKKRRADSEAASRKRWLRDLGYDPKTGEKLPDGSETAPDIKLGPDYQDDAEKPVQVDTTAIENAASAKAEAVFLALADAGVAPKSLGRFSKLIDRNGDIPAQVASLKEEFGELFTKRPRTTVADASAVSGGRQKPPAADANLTFEQKLAKRMGY